MTIDDVLDHVRAQMNLEAEAEHEVLEEIRAHLKEAAAASQTQGVSVHEALTQAAARFGVEAVGERLQAAHEGWGALEGIAGAALPVLFALRLRWLVYAPDGTFVGRREMLTQPASWTIAVMALLIPLGRSPRRRYALISWVVFWGLSVIISSAVFFALYGAVMGSSHSLWEAVSSAAKLPLLFPTTLVVCAPTLYFFNLNFGSNQSLIQNVALMLTTITDTSMRRLGVIGEERIDRPGAERRPIPVEGEKDVLPLRATPIVIGRDDSETIHHSGCLSFAGLPPPRASFRAKTDRSRTI